MGHTFYEPAVWPGCRDGQQRPGRCSWGHSQDIKGKVFPSPLSMPQTTCQILRPVWASQYENDINKLDHVQWRTPSCSGPGELALGGKLRDRGLFSLEERWLWGHLAVACLCPQGGHQAKGAGLFTAECGRKQRNMHKLKQERHMLEKGERTGLRKKYVFHSEDSKGLEQVT